MAIKPQVIEQAGKPALVVLSYAEWRQVEDILEDARDLVELRRVKARSATYMPLHLTKRIVNGENPVRVYRTFRNMTQETLATAVGTHKQYISQIERGTRSALPMRRKIAKALDIDANLLED